MLYLNLLIKIKDLQYTVIGLCAEEFTGALHIIFLSKYLLQGS